jgi:hypothetical protein
MHPFFRWIFYFVEVVLIDDIIKDVYFLLSNTKTCNRNTQNEFTYLI